jgi:uracil-DNA glycosylase family 4
MHDGTRMVCETGTGPVDASVMVVSKMPNSEGYQAALSAHLEDAGFNPEGVYWTHALKCRNFDHQPGRSDVKACRGYLDRELEVVKPSWVLALGNEALQALTGRSGIMKYRGRIFARGDTRIMGTLSFSAVQARPGFLDGWKSDLTYFLAMMQNKKSRVPDPVIVRVDSKDRLRLMGRALEEADRISYDVETTGPTEFAQDAAVVTLSVTCLSSEHGVETRTTYFVPLFHPESPWREVWVKILRWLVPRMRRVKKRVAQNGKFDDRWLWHFSGYEIHETFDTLIAAHILDENKPKGLKPQMRTRFGVKPWDIDVKSLLTTPLDDIEVYNGKDSHYTDHLYEELREELVAQPRLLRIFKHVAMPANNLYTGIERHGIWVNPRRLKERGIQARATLADIDQQLMAWVPDEVPVLSKAKRAKKTKINFNPSNFLRWLLFEHIGLPVIARGKPRDGRPGAPSVKEEVMLRLQMDTHHPIVDLLLERSKWQKYVSTYFTAYERMRDGNSRIHTTFKVWGTDTGRTSSGKAEQEKIAARVDNRGINIQQVPRDDFVRGLFGAPPGWIFLEADQSQIELRIVAYLSRDPTMLGLYQSGEDIHLATAAWVLGKPRSQITKEDRKKAKAVNFGFAYGMGARKFVLTAFTKYGLVFSVDEANAIRRTFFEQFPGLLEWHAKQRREVRRRGYVTSPLGRMRRLPDVYSTDDAVAREAERQAINSPVQSFASDLTLLAMVQAEREMREAKVRANILGTVHDSLNSEVWRPDLYRAAEIIGRAMENPPLVEKFGVHVDVPLICDFKVGQHWGDAEEMTLADIQQMVAVPTPA